ncbi:MAG: hypothetical protein JW849_05445 [Phycisphaerae bacterium]|nr:hypothetical protein [Phycisphaerae bacterium]
MSYTPAWTNADAQGRVTNQQWIGLCDVQELAEAVNRRRRLVYLSEQSFDAAEMISVAPLPALREQIADTILLPAAGGLGGEPPTPEAMAWLWPVADENENGVLAPNEGGDVSLFEQLNGTSDWTDASLSAGDFAEAVHANELRQAVEWISRGRWTLPIYFTTGLFSLLPDTPWMGEAIGNNGSAELRSVGYAVFRAAGSPIRGLTGATARASSQIEITADTPCQVEVYRVKRPIDFAVNLPTWNEYNPGASLAWQTPGGTGPDDAAYVGTLNLSAGVPGTLTGEAVRQAFQAVLDGANQFFLLRRSDTGYPTIYVSGRVVVEFDLSTPPN